jgi:hypothetical protein
LQHADSGHRRAQPCCPQPLHHACLAQPSGPSGTRLQPPPRAL